MSSDENENVQLGLRGSSLNLQKKNWQTGRHKHLTTLNMPDMETVHSTNAIFALLYLPSGKAHAAMSLTIM